MISLVRRYVYTLRYLRIRQIVFRAISLLRRYLKNSQPRSDRKNLSIRSVSLVVETIPVTWERLLRTTNGIEVCLLNKKHTFFEHVDWSFMNNGVLWNYHLHYLNWINSYLPPNKTPINWEIYFYEGYGRGRGADPYPTSLRIINIIKKISSYKSKIHENIIIALSHDVRLLSKNLEYHLLGNHLIENGFGLFWGGFFFKDGKIVSKAKRIILSQLREQVFTDGGHFERSPLYHSLILWRLLDTINLLEGSGCDSSPFNQALRGVASRMLNWLAVYPLMDDFGHVNDSTSDMAPTKESLLAYGERLGMAVTNTVLNESGFRVLRSSKGAFMVLADTGSVGPRYIPGHAHAGTLSFEVCVAGQPLLVDTGTSTYQPGELRERERSTKSHNTVSIGHLNSSETWDAFRVARRAHVVISRDTPSHLTARHDGYRSRLGVFHQREWVLQNNQLLICDKVIGSRSASYLCTAHFFFHPDVEIEKNDKNLIFHRNGFIEFQGAITIEQRVAEIASGFNQRRTTVSIHVRFRSELTTIVTSAIE